MSYSKIMPMNYSSRQLQTISCRIGPLLLVLVVFWCRAGPQPLSSYTEIDFNCRSFPVDNNRAILISTEKHIFVEINSFDQRFRIIAKRTEEEQQMPLYLGRIYLRPESYVIGYVRNNAFVGLIKVDGQTYNLEIKDSDSSRLLMYRSAGTRFEAAFDPVVRHRGPRQTKRFRHRYGRPRYGRRNNKFRQRLMTQNSDHLPRNMVCGLDLYADSSFANKIGDLYASAAEMLIAVREADKILSRIDFDGDGQSDNIGVIGRKLAVTEYLADNLNLANISDGELLLRTFQKRLTPHCLQVLFTHQNLKFSGISITGLANLGGVCRKTVNIHGVPQSPNSLLVSSLSNNRPLNRVQRIIDLTHEIGHTLGAEHDNERFGSDATCNPDAKDGGPFIMSTIHSDIAYQVSDLKNKQKFSICSKRAMNRVLNDPERSQCFTYRPSPICGDLHVDSGEECDPGGSALSGHIDPCCEQTGTARQCRIKSNVKCHPSQGSCCDVSSCEFLHWKKFAEQCRIDCWQPAMCLGNSATCPVTQRLPTGSKCWNCSSDICICDERGVCRDKEMPPIVPPLPPEDSHILSTILYLFLTIIFASLVVFCVWMTRFPRSLWYYITDKFRDYRRGRVRNRLSEELLSDYSSDASDEEHEL